MVTYITVRIVYAMGGVVKDEIKVFVGRTVSQAIRRMREYIETINQDENTDIEFDILDVDKDE